MPSSARPTRVPSTSSTFRFARTSAALLGAVALVIPATAYAGAGDGHGSSIESSTYDKALAAFGFQKAPKAAPGKKPRGLNPYLAFLPDPSKADYAGWNRFLAQQAEARQDRLQARTSDPKALAQQPILVDEEEPSGIAGGNDTLETAQRIDGFGTGRRENGAARILGDLAGLSTGVSQVEPNDEDDGAIPLARDTGVSAIGEGVRTTGTIGDGPHDSAGTGTGDYDFYAVDGKAGGQIVVQVDAVDELDPVVLLWDAEGDLVAANDDRGDGTFNSLLRFNVPEDGTYYAMVTGYLSLPYDPFDPASGDGAESEGDYEITVTQREEDVDVYAVELRAGDVVSASAKGEATLVNLYGPDGTLVHGSDQDGSALYPPESPLPGGGNAVTEHVASVSGVHYLEIRGGVGRYDTTLEVYRPTAEQDRTTQTIFLDFDGERLNTAIFGGPGVRELSPFRAWLGRWGLTAADEEAVARQVIATVEENLRHELRESGLAGRVRLEVKNSYDHADPFGEENVSRVVIGGSIDESGMPTIGVAQYIDPGNFGHEDSAVVLLDVLSGPASDEASLNHYITEESDRIAFVGQALGNVVAHEAGHFLGNWHTDQYNDVANLMDAGGNFPLMFGVGPDGVGGTADDDDVAFGEDDFNLDEGFLGIENTLTRVGFGLGSSSRRLP